MLLVETRLVGLCAVGGFADEDVGSDGRDLGLHEVTILLTTEVTGVEDSKAGNLDEEHAGAEDVACMIRGEAQTTCDGDVLVEVDGLDLAPGCEHLVFVKEIVVVAGVADADEVRHEEAVYGLGRVGHVYLAVTVAEVCLFHDVGEGGGMVEVEVGDEDGVDGGPVELVDEGQCGNTCERGMYTGVADDGLALVLEHAADRPTS
ncbi:hypothetical protein L1887_59654 [Cichorium endivia]|nr:hypothetical protein L1887_59654 [Cichorium endivia]